MELANPDNVKSVKLKGQEIALKIALSYEARLRN